MTHPMNAPAPASSTDGPMKQPESLLDARLRQVRVAIADAAFAVHDLVTRLEPILPVDFGKQAMPQAPPPDEPPAGSALAARLRDISCEGQQLVVALRAIVEAVDL